jgi:hypothetical protein
MPERDNEDQEFERVRLTVVQAAQEVIAEDLRDYPVEHHVYVGKHLGHKLAMGVKVYLAGTDERAYEQVITVPADAWSHVKLWVRDRANAQPFRTIKRWLWERVWDVVTAKRFGGRPRMTEHRFTAKGRLLFPEIPLGLRRDAVEVVVSRMDRGSSRPMVTARV